jgi:hypothetical protein
MSQPKETQIAQVLELAAEAVTDLGMRSSGPLCEVTAAQLDDRVAALGERALCVQRRYDFFSTGAPDSFTKAVCADCPVKPECLIDALTDGSKRGPRAGTSAFARRLVRTHLMLTRPGPLASSTPVQVVDALNARLA